MKPLLLFVCGTALLSGCAVTLAPHVPYLPVIRDRGQAEARVSTGFSGSELQLGYQLSDKVVVHGALLAKGRARNGTKLYSGDLGLGYYYSSPNGFWRFGVHGGLASGGGNSSGGGGSFEGSDPTPPVDYRVRYTYAYVQPTMHLHKNRQTWSFGLRLGRTYYHQLMRTGADTVGGLVSTRSYGGTQVPFGQTAFQYSYRASPLVHLSTTFGTQALLHGQRPFVSMSSAIIAQIGVQLTLHELPKRRP